MRFGKESQHGIAATRPASVSDDAQIGETVPHGISLPEFGRLRDVERLFGIKRGTLYNLIKGKKIRSVSLRENGAKQGCRLIELASVQNYLRALMVAQESVTPGIAPDATPLDTDNISQPIPGVPAGANIDAVTGVGRAAAPVNQNQRKRTYHMRIPYKNSGSLLPEGVADASIGQPEYRTKGAGEDITHVAIPFVVRGVDIKKEYPFTLEKGSALRHDLEKLNGRPFNEVELTSVDPDTFKGANCQVLVKHKRIAGGKLAATVDSVITLVENPTKPEAVSA